MMDTSVENPVPSKENPGDLNRDFALMVKEISKIGPRVPEIARRLGRHKETVRYWYKKIEEHRFGIQAELNFEALGLRRIRFTVKVAPTYEPYIRPLMIAMSELCYLVGYARSMPGDTYVLDANVPDERSQEYLDLFDELKRLGIFTEVDSNLYDQFRNVPMQTDHYDFTRGRWNFNDISEAGNVGTRDVPGVTPRANFDRIDLLLAKELSVDATRELREIQKSIWDTNHVDINYKTLCWHLKEHVEKKRLLKGYKINWIGSHYDTKSGRALRPQHTYTGTELFVKRPTREEMARIVEKMAVLPVVWSQSIGRDYHAQVAIPNEFMVETLEYLETIIQPIREKSEFYLVDMRSSLAFTFSYKLFDEESRSWQFNKEDLLAKFAEFIVQVRNAN